MTKGLRKKIFLGFLILPLILGFSTISNLNSKQTEKNELTQTKSDNPNNNSYVNYNDANNYSGLGNIIDFSITENGENDQLLTIEELSISITLYDEFSGMASDFWGDKIFFWFTLYDTTNDDMEVVEYFRTAKTLFSYGTVASKPNIINLISNSSTPPEYEVSLQEFHTYRIGFNIEQNDDMEAYSRTFFLSKPSTNKFQLNSTENSILVEWDLSVVSDEGINFTFNEIFLIVNDEKYILGTDPSGSYEVTNLKGRTDYLVVFGYDANKVLLNGSSYNIVDTSNFKVTTKMPENFSSQTIIATSVLLIILLVILLILGLIVLYWNIQRRKISGLALMSEDQNPNTNYGGNNDANHYDSNQYSPHDDYGIDVDTSDYSDIEEWNHE